MTTLELKSIIKHQIDNIDDETDLLEIKSIIDAKHTIYQLPKEIVDRLNEAEAEYERGEFHTEEEMNNFFEEWRTKE